MKFLQSHEQKQTDRCRGVSWQDDTFFGVQAHLHSPLLGSQQSFGHLGHRWPLGVWSVQEAAGARLLHHLSPQVAAHLAEGIVAEDDGAVLHLRVGDDELSIFGKEKQEGWEREHLVEAEGVKPSNVEAADVCVEAGTVILPESQQVLRYRH